MEPPNKGHAGDNINSAFLSSIDSCIERLSSFRGSHEKSIGVGLYFLNHHHIMCFHIIGNINLHITVESPIVDPPK